MSEVLKNTGLTVSSWYSYCRPIGWVLWRANNNWYHRWALEPYTTQFGLLCGYLFYLYQMRQKQLSLATKPGEATWGKRKYLLLATTAISVILVSWTIL